MNKDTAILAHIGGSEVNKQFNFIDRSVREEDSDGEGSGNVEILPSFKNEWFAIIVNSEIVERANVQDIVEVSLLLATSHGCR